MNAIEKSRRNFILLMLAPTTVLLFGLTIFPFVASLAMSFTNYSLVTPDKLAVTGLANYGTLFSSGDFWYSLGLTALFTTVAVSLQLVLGVAIATLLHHESRAVPLLRAIYLLPMAITPVAATFTFRMMFNPSVGIFNYVMKLAGLPPQDWLGSPHWALASLITVDTWQWTPFILLIAAGGLAAMDEEPLEAARMDGAGARELFFHHTLPMLMPYLGVAVVFRSIDAFKTFDIIFALTGGGPGIVTRTLNLLAYKQGIQFLSMGYAAAIAIVMLIITAVSAQIFLRRARLFHPKAAL
jgi:multiple sugar transport system permease protein